MVGFVGAQARRRKRNRLLIAISILFILIFFFYLPSIDFSNNEENLPSEILPNDIIDENSLASEVEELILTTLEKLVAEGVSEDLINSSLHQLEIGQREVSGGGMPYGLQLMLGCMNACIHHDNPISMLDLDANFTKLKALISKKGYLEELITLSLIHI